MKIVIYFKGSILKDDKPAVHAKDVRRYIGSIVSDKYKKLFLWHESSPAPFLYLKPHKDCFEILTYREDMSDAIEHIIARVTLNPEIKLNGVSLEVERVRVKNDRFAVIEEGKFRYRTRTPIIIGASKTEHAIYNSIKDDEEKLKEFTTKCILDSVKYQIKQYFDFDFEAVEDGTILYHNLDHFTVKHYHGDGFEWRPAVWCDFTCSYSLPQTVGYKNGLGFGQIIKSKNQRN